MVSDFNFFRFPRLGRSAFTKAVGGILLSTTSATMAGTLYFDTNGATAGSTNSAGQQTWNTGAVAWSIDPTGSSATAIYTDNSDCVFSAGTNAVSAYNISTAGNKVANSITIEEGTITFLPSATPPTRMIGPGGITLASTANGAVTFSNANGGNTLLLSANQTWANNHATAGFVVACPVRGSAATGTVTLTSTVNGAGDMTLSNVVSDGTAGGNVGITNASTGAGRLLLQGANTYTGATTSQSGTIVIGAAATTNVLTNAGGLDVQGGKVVFDYTGGTSPAAAIKTAMDAAYLANSNFSTGQIRGATLPAGRTLGYADDGLSTVTIRVTLAGDANLDGTVDFNDFLVLQNNFGQTGTRFDQGNFNYDGATDFNDFLALQNNFGQSISGERVPFTSQQVAALAAFGQTHAVPEPGMACAIGLAAAGLVRRRSGQNRTA